MIHQALPWLPPAPAEGLERQIASLAGEWAARWIGGTPSLTIEPAKQPFDPAVAWRGCAAIAIGVRAEMLVALAQAALAGHGDIDNSRDREVFADIGRQATNDLAEFICAIASPGADLEDLPPESLGNPEQSYRILGTDWALELILDSAAQVRLRRHVAGSRGRPALGRLAEALAPETVELGCHLGEASLWAADVAALAPGDLIVLDRRIAEPLPLTVAGNVTAHGKASIEAADGALSVRIADVVDLTAGND